MSVGGILALVISREENHYVCGTSHDFPNKDLKYPALRPQQHRKESNKLELQDQINFAVINEFAKALLKVMVKNINVSQNQAVRHSHSLPTLETLCFVHNMDKLSILSGGFMGKTW